MTTDTATAMRMALEALDVVGYINDFGDFEFTWKPWMDAAVWHPLIKRSSAIAALREAIERDGWQPIETAPRDGSLFLCWVSAIRYGETDEGQQYQQDASQIDFCSWRDGPPDIPGHGYFDPCCGQIADSQDVTHWRPLPPAPKD